MCRILTNTLLNFWLINWSLAEQGSFGQWSKSELELLFCLCNAIYRTTFPDSFPLFMSFEHQKNACSDVFFFCDNPGNNVIKTHLIIVQKYLKYLRIFVSYNSCYLTKELFVWQNKFSDTM